FSYDSKKSGGLTVSHLRFGDKPIKSSYLVDHADYIACHNQSYVGKYDLLEGIKENGIFLLNCPWEDGELKEKLPAKLRSEILEKKVRFYTIDASRAARAAGMGKRINMVMQSAFFCLGQMIPYEDAKKHL
ncbi:2-oxoacid:acceptor oxidoreductase family protein, partial [Parabacteroides distasonis]